MQIVNLLVVIPDSRMREGVQKGFSAKVIQIAPYSVWRVQHNVHGQPGGQIEGSALSPHSLDYSVPEMATVGRYDDSHPPTDDDGAPIMIDGRGKRQLDPIAPRLAWHQTAPFASSICACSINQSM